MTSTTTQFSSRVAGALAAIAAVSVTAIGIAAGVQGANVQANSSAAAPHSMKVAYTVLDLSQPMGAQLMYHRLQQATSGACGTLARADVGAYRAWQRCYDATLQRAVLQVNAPELLAVYRGDAGRAGHAG